MDVKQMNCCSMMYITTGKGGKFSLSGDPGAWSNVAMMRMTREDHFHSKYLEFSRVTFRLWGCHIDMM
jgi:hypothetical protein